MLYNSTMFTNFTTVMVKTNKMEMVLILMIVTNLLSSVPSGTDSTTRNDLPLWVLKQLQVSNAIAMYLSSEK